MSQTLAYKILGAHLLQGTLTPGSPITIRMDQTLTQDATGTMVYLQLEALGAERVKTELSVSYVDHNTLQNGFENADDHAFIQSVAARHGIVYSKPGNGICHQLHLENFGIPGKTLLGSDSHTPTGGGIGMIAIGAGGLDVAVAMAKGTYSLACPKVLGVHVTGQLPAWVSAKDVILAMLQKLSVKGGVGKIVEYYGEGLKALSVSDRATITNMGAELGATCSLFPSDENTRAYLKAQGREQDYVPLAADEGAVYDEAMELNLSELVPLAACPHSPDNVKDVRAIGAIPVHQVAIGSCTNSSYTDLMRVAAILKGKHVHPDVSLVIAPGSSTILAKLASNGALADLIAAGARVIECACGPCIGMGLSPRSGGVSLRTFNRNFKGRSGTADASVYLVSPETAAVSAIAGVLTDGRDAALPCPVFGPEVFETETFQKNDAFFLRYDREACSTEPPVMGPNIKPFPLNEPLPDTLTATITMVCGDNITTDDIMPAGAKVLPYRSNVPKMSEFCFGTIDDQFPARCRAVLEQAPDSHFGSAIVGGQNYGQGSSREHAALAPLHLGVRMVVAKSFARIHRSNLINSGILPLTFANPSDADSLQEGDVLVLQQAAEQITQECSEAPLLLLNQTHGTIVPVRGNFSADEKNLLLAGGMINRLKQH